MQDQRSASLASLQALEATAREIWDGRSDLRDRFRSLASIGYWNWLMVEGLVDYPRILDHLPAAPPELRQRVGDGSLEHYVAGGLSDAQNIFLRLGEGGFDPSRGGALLDHGCGSGRILRMAARFAESCELHGADVDAEAIDWCRAHLSFARYEVIAPRPPTPYPDGRFDAVYSFSIFTHLPEGLHRAWLEELQRIMRPGATLVVTTAGRRVVERFLARDVHPALSTPTAEEMRAGLPQLATKGFVYYPLKHLYAAIPEQEREADVYGMTFLYEPYIRAHWLDLFELVALHEAPQDWQDYVVLRRR